VTTEITFSVANAMIRFCTLHKVHPLTKHSFEIIQPSTRTTALIDTGTSLKSGFFGTGLITIEIALNECFAFIWATLWAIAALL
jgi:hypothetical protein